MENVPDEGGGPKPHLLGGSFVRCSSPLFFHPPPPPPWRPLTFRYTPPAQMLPFNLWHVCLRDLRSGMTPKWGLGVATLPVGALCFYQAHVGPTVLPTWPLWAHLFYSVCLQCFRAWEGMLPPGACRTSRAPARRIVSCRGLCASSLCPQIPHLPAPTFGVFRYWC